MPKRFVGSEELADVASQFYDIANRVQTAVKSMIDAKLESTHINIDAIVNSYLPIICDWAIELPAKVEAEISRRERGLPPQSVLNQKKNAKALKKRKQKEKETA